MLCFNLKMKIVLVVNTTERPRAKGAANLSPASGLMTMVSSSSDSLCSCSAGCRFF